MPTVVLACSRCYRYRDKSWCDDCGGTGQRRQEVSASLSRPMRLLLGTLARRYPDSVPRGRILGSARHIYWDRSHVWSAHSAGWLTRERSTTSKGARPVTAYRLTPKGLLRLTER